MHPDDDLAVARPAYRYKGGRYQWVDQRRFAVRAPLTGRMIECEGAVEAFAVRAWAAWVDESARARAAR